MRRRITRALYAVAAAGIALTSFGFAGAGAQATAAARSLSPPVYTDGGAGYSATGRWFRYVETTVTVPPVIPSTKYACNMLITLGNTAPVSHLAATVLVRPGGGSGSVGWGNGQILTPIAISPRIGDQLRISVYYDRNGHTSFTAVDVTQGITRTVRVKTGNVTYNEASVGGNAGGGPVPPPAADTRLWKVSGTRLTTYSGTHGTMTGPWQTSRLIQTSTGTAAGTVLRSPSGLWNGGANFGIWLRALPVDYTSAFAGYVNSAARFRFISTTMTVPAAQVPAANGGETLISLVHNGGPTPRPYADIGVRPGGGAASISYASNAKTGTFAMSPKPGDQLGVSIFYDQHGHYVFTVTDIARSITEAVTVAALYADSMPLNSAEVVAIFDNRAVTPPPADIRLWNFTDILVTTYRGSHGSILGPWATSEFIDTTTGTAAGAVVADASVLSHAGQDFSVWLRHH